MSPFNGVVRLCEEALGAITDNPRLTSTDATVFAHLIRRLDVGRDFSPFISSQFANGIGLSVKELCESFQRLTREGIVEQIRTDDPFYSYRLVYESTSSARG
jgi:hypothetical protein